MSGPDGAEEREADRLERGSREDWHDELRHRRAEDDADRMLNEIDPWSY